MAGPGSIDMYKNSVNKHAQTWSGAIATPSAKLGKLNEQISALEARKQLSAEEKSELDKLKKEAQKYTDQIAGANKTLNLNLSKIALPEDESHWNAVGGVIKKAIETQSVEIRKNLSIGLGDIDVDVKAKKLNGASVNISLDF